MVSKTPGIGQAYLGADKDKNDGWFDGNKTYKLTVPPNPPAKQFWSLTIYDTHDRLGIDNTTQNADVSSRDEGLRRNRRRIGRSLCRSCGAQAALRGTGYRRLRARPGSLTSGSTARWSLTST